MWIPELHSIIPSLHIILLNYTTRSTFPMLQGRIQDLFIGGVEISSEARDEGSEYKTAGGPGGRCKPPEKFWNLEPLRVNLSVVWQIISYFLGYFCIKNIWENIFYDFIYTRSGDFLGFASQMKHFSSQIYWHNEGTITVQHTTFSKITTEYN